VLPVTDDDLKTIRAKHIRAKLFANRKVGGRLVAVRLNLNFGAKGQDGKKYSIQTIHDGVVPRGRVLGYDSSATVDGAVFVVDQRARADIAAGRKKKYPMAGVVGVLTQKPAKLEGVEIRFNPKTSHLFTRADDGRAVHSAEEVTVFHTRAYARGWIKYWSADEAPQPLEGIASDALF
jgi:hypothetical protein